MNGTAPREILAALLDRVIQLGGAPRSHGVAQVFT